MLISGLEPRPLWLQACWKHWSWAAIEAGTLSGVALKPLSLQKANLHGRLLCHGMLLPGSRQGCGETRRQDLSVLQKGAAAGSREVCLEVRKTGKKPPGGRPGAPSWTGGRAPAKRREPLWAAVLQPGLSEALALGPKQEAARSDGSALNFRLHCVLSGHVLLKWSLAPPQCLI